VGSVYLAALIIGLGTILLQLFMSGDSDADAGGHDVSVDADADVGGHHGAGSDIGGGFLPIFLSLRFWTFGLMAFGMVGAILHFLQLVPLVIVPFVALALGLGSGLLASWTFRALARAATQSGTQAGDAVGHVGRVLVAPHRGGRGKVRVELGGQTFDYIAVTEEEALAEGEAVLIEEMREGTVQVSRAPAEFIPDRRDKG
jgi:membrane protein implicated in regulation of membrane protease activity